MVCSSLPELSEALFAGHDRARNQQPQRARRSPPKALGSPARRLELILDQRGADMADVPGGASGLLVREYKGRKADRLVTRIDLAIISLIAELCRHER